MICLVWFFFSSDTSEQTVVAACAWHWAAPAARLQVSRFAIAREITS
jgi:hypothetical protein